MVFYERRKHAWRIRNRIIWYELLNNKVLKKSLNHKKKLILEGQKPL